MNSLSILNNEELLKTYFLALNMNLDAEFIDLLRTELDIRTLENMQPHTHNNHAHLVGVQ